MQTVNTKTDIHALNEPIEVEPQCIHGMTPGTCGVCSSFKVATLDDVINTHTAAVMRLCNGNRTHAARLLGISRRSLLRWIERRGTDYGFQLARKPESR